MAKRVLGFTTRLEFWVSEAFERIGGRLQMAAELAEAPRSNPAWVRSVKQFRATMGFVNEQVYIEFDPSTYSVAGSPAPAPRSDPGSPVPVLGQVFVETMSGSLGPLMSKVGDLYAAGNQLEYESSEDFHLIAIRDYGASLDISGLEQLIQAMGRIDGTFIQPNDLPIISHVPSWEYFVNPILGTWTQVLALICLTTSQTFNRLSVATGGPAGPEMALTGGPMGPVFNALVTTGKAAAFELVQVLTQLNGEPVDASNIGPPIGSGSGAGGSGGSGSGDSGSGDSGSGDSGSGGSGSGASTSGGSMSGGSSSSDGGGGGGGGSGSNATSGSSGGGDCELDSDTVPGWASPMCTVVNVGTRRKLGRAFIMNFDLKSNGSCDDCEYRQYVRGYTKGNGNVIPHYLPSSTPPYTAVLLSATVFNEDGLWPLPGFGPHYGHRDQTGDANDRYLPTRATGCKYRGADHPGITGPVGSTVEVSLRFKGELVHTPTGTVIESWAWSVVCPPTVL